MTKTTTTLTVHYDSDSEEFTCVLEYCDPIPGRHIYSAIESEPAQRLSDALRDLADQVAEQYEDDAEEKEEAGCA